MTQKDVSCSSCGAGATVTFDAAPYATFNCDGCGTSSIAFR